MNRVLLALLVAAVCSDSCAGRPPNIVLIMADDLGYEGLRCNGGESYDTPHLDALAAEGMRFTHAYSQPVCTPSRVKIMTGLSNARNYASFGILRRGSRTFGHMLQDAGYRTCIVGKWQLLGRGDKEGLGTHPRDAGFHEYRLWQVEQRASRYWNPVLEENGHPLKTSESDFGPDLFVNYAEEFMARHRAEPFFVYFPMAIPHAPVVSTPANREQKPLRGQEGFAGMVAYMDSMVGRLADHVRMLGIERETILIFTTDNGTGRQFKSVLDGREIPGGKASTKDSGTHVPLIAWCPGTIPAGRVCDDLIDFSDFVPTLAEIGGGRHPYPDQADGQSFLPQLRGEPGTPRASIYCFSHARPERGAARRFARDRQFKLYGDGNLYHIPTDPDEVAPLERNVSREASLARERLQQVLDRMPAELPTDR